MNSCKDVLIISNMYPSKKYPHYGVFVKNIEHILSDNEYKVRHCVFKKKDNKLIKVISYMFFYICVIFQCIHRKNQIIYMHYASHCGLPVLLANKIRRNKLVVNVHGNDLVPETKDDEKYEKIVKDVIKLADKVVCPSLYFQRVLYERYHISNAIVYPSGGVDIQKFHKIDKLEACKKLNISEEYRYIGYVSRIEANKGWDTFLEACKPLLDEFQDLRLIVVGGGCEHKDYKLLANNLRIENKIMYFPLLPQDSLVYVYNALDVFAFPTRRRSESLGLVGLEAMACETITVLPDKYGPTSYEIDGINSYVFKSQDVHSLENAIRKGLTNRNENIKKEARKTAVKFGKEETEYILIDAFSNL